MILNSIRWQIQMWHGALLALITVSLLVAFYQYERGRRFSEVDQQLREQFISVLPALAGEMRGRPPPPRPPAPDDLDVLSIFDDPGAMRGPPDRGAGPLSESELEADLASRQMYYAMLGRRGEVVTKSANVPSPIPAVMNLTPQQRTLGRSREGVREMSHLMRGSDVLVIGMVVTRIEQQLNRLAWQLAAAGAGILALGLSVGWWMTSRAIRPIAKISSAAESIASGHLDRRIDVAETRSELGGLAKVLNHTFDRLQHAFDQQVRFTADASHELRTPISVILSQAELALSREREAKDYRAALEVCRRSGEQKLFREQCDLAEVMADSLRLIAPLAEEKKITLESSLIPSPACVDGDLMHQVFTNLLSNAIKHNQTGTRVETMIQPDGDIILITVRDHGAGIPADALPHLFERFYRADKARSRTDGSTGLGLAITKAIIERHGGTIAVTSEMGKGTCFALQLPAEDRITAAE
jgi:two-component system, OmpR family, sensor kinase